MDNADKEMARVAANVALTVLGAPLEIVGGNGNGTWDPVEPPDLHLAKLPPVAKDGTVECSACVQRVPFAAANIVGQTYVCNPCTAARSRAQAAAALPPDAENIKLGRPKTGIYLLVGGGVAIVGALALVFAYA